MLPLPPPFPAQSVAGVLFSFWELMEEALVRCDKGLDCPLFLETRNGMYLLLFTRTSLQVSLILLAYPPLSAYQLRVQPLMEIQYFHSPQHCTSSISRRRAGCEECIKSTYIWMPKCLHLPALPPWPPLIVSADKASPPAGKSEPISKAPLWVTPRGVTLIPWLWRRRGRLISLCRHPSSVHKPYQCHCFPSSLDIFYFDFLWA